MPDKLPIATIVLTNIDEKIEGMVIHAEDRYWRLQLPPQTGKPGEWMLVEVQLKATGVNETIWEPCGQYRFFKITLAPQ